MAVADGDTVTVLDASNTQHKVRLAGIDAPEKHQAFGTVSRQHLAALVFGKTVNVQFEHKDRFGRQIGKITVAGKDVNLEQIRAGLAWHYKQYEREQTLKDRLEYAKNEEEARRAYRGLWDRPDPVAPWEFRRARRRK